MWNHCSMLMVAASGLGRVIRQAARKTPGAAGLVAGVHVQLDVDSERHSFASTIDKSPVATDSVRRGGDSDSLTEGAAGGAAGFGVASAIGGGVACAAAGGGAGSSRGVTASRGGAAASSLDAAGAGGGDSRNSNHHAASASANTIPITIGAVGRFDAGATGYAVRFADVA